MELMQPYIYHIAYILAGVACGSLLVAGIVFSGRIKQGANHLRQKIISFFKKSWKWFSEIFDERALVFSLSVFILIFALAFFITGELSFGGEEENMFSVIYRLTLIIVSILGFPALVTRMNIAKEQLKQLDYSQQQLRTTQYNNARISLSASQLNERIAGIQDLWRLAKSFPQEEYENVMSVFTSFLQFPPPHEEKSFSVGQREDVQLILNFMARRMNPVENAPDYQINFRGFNLGKAHLMDAQLQGADLANSFLNEAHFEVAQLQGAQLVNAKLQAATLDGADLEKANLAGANLESASLRAVNLKYALLANANLKRVNLDGAKLQRADLSDADITNVNLRNAKLKNATLKSATLAGAYLQELRVVCANFEGANLVGTNMEGVNLQGVNLINADLRDAEFKGAKLQRVIINGANFERAKDLTQEQLNDCVFATDFPDKDNTKPPTLPKGLELTCHKMTLKEWEELREKILSEEKD